MDREGERESERESERERGVVPSGRRIRRERAARAIVGSFIAIFTVR